MGDTAIDFALSLGYRGSGNPLSLQWYLNFMARWPELQLLKPRRLRINSAKTVPEECVSSYFKALEASLRKHNLLKKP